MYMAYQISAHPYISDFHSVHPTVHCTAVGQITTLYPMQLSAIRRLVFLKDTPLLIYSLTKMESKNVFVVSRRPLQLKFPWETRTWWLSTWTAVKKVMLVVLSMIEPRSSWCTGRCYIMVTGLVTYHSLHPAHHAVHTLCKEDGHWKTSEKAYYPSLTRPPHWLPLILRVTTTLTARVTASTLLQLLLWIERILNCPSLLLCSFSWYYQLLEIILACMPFLTVEMKYIASLLWTSLVYIDAKDKFY